MENLSKKISLAKGNSSSSIQGAPCFFFQVAFSYAYLASGALVIAEIPRRDKTKIKKRKKGKFFLSFNPNKRTKKALKNES